MTTPSQKPGGKTIADWLAQPEEARLELIDGEFIEKAAPTIEHGMAQAGTAMRIRDAFNRKPGGPGGPGGWWIGSEIDIVLDGRGYRPDLVGWRRERMPVIPKERPVTVRPDWICEIVSESLDAARLGAPPVAGKAGSSARSTDTVKKLRRYHQSGVPHYWIIDQLDRTLTVHRHGLDGYLIALRAEADERVRAEPFDAIELHVAVLLGDDPD